MMTTEIPLRRPCGSCLTGRPHPTNFPDWIICAACGQYKAARHNHALCIECEGGRLSSKETDDAP